MSQQSLLDINSRSIIFVSKSPATLSLRVELSDIATIYSKGDLVICKIESIDGIKLQGRVLVAGNALEFPLDSAVSFEMGNIFGITKP